MYQLILPLGIINFILILVQILGGTKVIKVSFRTHKYLGITLGVSALVHGAIAFIFA